ncbi:hypothetical protein [Nocardiopsis sp. CA-288880]|uniref:hypothetical protein n=1 Tax=Nocardiopsis sp. CA-288880 TaxID=3239995 RepID=UPI003D98BBF6
MTPEIEAAHRALRGLLLHDGLPENHKADITTAGEAFLGVLSAFFRNVMEYAFTGHEPAAQVHAYLEDLKRCYPSELHSLEPARMALFVLEQIGPGAPPPGQTRLLVGSDVFTPMSLLTLYTAKQEGLAGERLELYLFGATARYYEGEL